MEKAMDEERGDIVERVDDELAAEECPGPGPQGAAVPLDPEVQRSLTWFQDQKLGVIFHWGLYAQAGIVESWQLSKEDEWARKKGAWRPTLEQLRHDYWALADEFNPQAFCPECWSQACEDAGFRYMLFTTKHHDGFSMYDTAFSDYKVTNGPCRTDVLRGVMDAFHKQGLATGLYFSKPDWRCPFYWEPGSDPRGRYASYDPQEKAELWARFNEFVKNQLVELCTNYGNQRILWLDGGWVNHDNHEFLDMDDIVGEVRRLQPGLIVVDRTIGGAYENYVTPERKIPEVPPERPWESNIPLAKNWGYVPRDVYKSFSEILESVVRIVCLGGNALLGVGPKPDGTLPEEALGIMRRLGAWMRKYGEGIYGTQGCPSLRVPGWQATVSDEAYHLFSFDAEPQAFCLAELAEAVDVGAASGVECLTPGLRSQVDANGGVRISGQRDIEAEPCTVLRIERR